jgi:GAF domain-containing protein/anti-sigma regulatory factor (Ser/Thr protein kinase)
MSPGASTIAGDQSREELRRELVEAREQQAATAEILTSISSSATDAKQVFAKIAASAARLCDAYDVVIRKVDGEVLRLVAHHGPIPVASTLPLTCGVVAGGAVLDRKTIHVADVQAESDKYPVARGIGHRTILAVPLMRAGEAIGVIVMRRTEVRPFTDRQIDLLKTFADQAVIAIENTRLFEEVQARSRELAEALEQQTVSSEVLRIISSSPGDLRPVFQAMLENAVRICDAKFGHLWLQEGDGFRTVAVHNAPRTSAIKPGSLHRPPPDMPVARAAITKQVVQLDIKATQSYIERDPFVVDAVDVAGFRTVLAVPMLKDNELIGAFTILRQEVRPFTDKQIELVKTFADQAVIAIENTRLFEAEQASKRELQESLEVQTAISEVLAVIGRSPSDLQPVLDVIAEIAVRLCQADVADFRLLRDGLYHIAATTVNEPIRLRTLRDNPIAPSRSSVVGRVALERRTVHVPDIHADPEYNYAPGPNVAGMRAILGVPLLREGEVIGAIVLFNRIVKPFTRKQIALVTTFANQALIAIENTRLFEEVQARTRELSEALEQQTATSEVLSAISSSPTDVDPVLDAIVRTAVTLCNSYDAVIILKTAQDLRVAAHHGPMALDFERLPVRRDTVAGRTILDGVPVHIHDLAAQSESIEYPLGQQIAARLNQRTVLGLPLLREGQAIGCLFLRRTELLPFSEKQISLLQTFADQAVIAIENARLFEEVQARNRDLTALTEVGRAVSSTLDVKVVLKTIVDRAVDLSGTDAGSIFYYRPEVGRFELGETVGIGEDVIVRLRKLDIAVKDSGLGEAIALRKPLLIPDLAKRESNPLRAAAIEAGFRAALIVPLLSGDEPLGALVLQRREAGEFPATVVTLMQSFADQSAIALENARLFEEIARKSRELEIASQHKSQFVANMSHELRTPLAAILGYAELMQEGFYEPLGQKSLDALARIRSNGKHLLGLINTVLDIAKIESGQFSLNLGEYALGSVVETVRSATEALAEAKKLALKTDVAESLPIGLGDEQRLTQVLLNLVGNAIKFTDSGEVRVTAKAVNGHFNLCVTDTGPGIPVEHQNRIFDQFHQVDSSNTKAKGGTGLGLAIAKQIVEMHGGRIWVESTLGKGSTFQMELPTRAVTT